MAKAILFDLGDTLITEDSVGDEHTPNAKLEKVPYIEEVLRELKGKYKLAVVTNTSTSREKDIRLALKGIGIEHYFDTVVTSVDIGREKPEPEIFCEALRRLQVEPKESVMVGNRIKTDILGANKLGMVSVLFRWNNRYQEEITSPLEKPHYVISSMRQLPLVLSQTEKMRKK